MMTETQQISQGFASIMEELKKQRIMSSDEPWSADEIAAYLKLGKRTVQNKIITDKTFPTGIPLPSGGRRWLAKEVRSWYEKRR